MVHTQYQQMTDMLSGMMCSSNMVSKKKSNADYDIEGHEGHHENDEKKIMEMPKPKQNGKMKNMVMKKEW